MQEITSPWAIHSDDVIKSLNTAHTGLTDKEAEVRLSKYGTNTFHNKEKKSSLSILFKQFLSPLIFLLIGAGILTGILSEWIDTIVIAFAVLLNVILGFYHEFHAENTLEKLNTYIKDRARIIRGGVEQEVDSTLLVPGDILKLSYGVRIPADARIITVNNFQVDEAILTGESVPIEKNNDLSLPVSQVAERKNIAHAGTLVVQGYATAVIYATGDNTEIGKIASIVSSTKRVETPLQKGISHLAWLVFIIVIVVVIGIFVLGILRGEPLLPMLLLSSAVAVGAVPEALPVTLTVILAIGAERIARKKGIIRKLSAAETLGSTTLIMTDKTGTLTLADMQLVGLHTKNSLLSKNQDTIDNKIFSEDQKNLLRLSSFNIDVSIENKTEDKKDWVFHGRPFEVNIAKACLNNNISLSSMMAGVSSLVLPFNSTNKFSIAENDGNYIVMGAPDILLKRSNISKEEYIALEEWIESTSRDGKRLIGIATFKKGNINKKVTPEEVNNLDFIGMLVFYDPIRPEVPSAIANIESHGVRMVLVTGDLKGTAISVAKSLNWHVEENEVLVGSELGRLSDTELLALIPNIKIFARVTPEDKLRIGRLYQQLGEVVAMTGDGVNDAPALKAMDIGISLGSGSDVAKSAADLVLLDDNFETISTSIDEGHRILANIRKTVVYLMSNSLDEVFVIGGSLIVGLALPLTALQIIWVNLFTGSLPALAFAFDENMDRKKYSKNESKRIFTKEVKVLTLGIGVLSSLFLFLLYYALIQFVQDMSEVRSIFFVCFASYILAASFSFRSLYNPIFSYAVFSNRKLNWSIIIAIVILIVTMAVPYIRHIFELAPLPLYAIPLVIFWLIFNVFLVEAAKYFLRKRNHVHAKSANLRVA